MINNKTKLMINRNREKRRLTSKQMLRAINKRMPMQNRGMLRMPMSSMSHRKLKTRMKLSMLKLEMRRQQMPRLRMVKLLMLRPEMVRQRIHKLLMQK